MRHYKAQLHLTMIAAALAVAGAGSHAMTIDEAMERLKTHTFGQNDDALNFLYESAVGSHSDPAVRKQLNDGFTRILESDAAYDAKQFACRQLALTATFESAAGGALARHLADEQMSHIALYALSHIDSGEVDRALLSALDKSSGRAKLGIISALGNRRISGAIEPLGKLIVSGDQEFAIEAIKALGRIGTQAAYAQLFTTDVLKEPTDAEILAVAHALLDFGERLAADGQAEPAREAYFAAFDPHHPGHVRAAALKGLAEVLGDKAESYVTEALKSDNEDLYGMAAVIVRDTPSRSGAEAMSRGLAGLRPEVQALLINALAGRSDGAGAAMIKDACDSRNASMRIAALGALGKVGDESCIALLIKHAAADSGDEGAAALESIGTLKGPKVNPALVGELKRSDNAGKAVICLALLERNAVEAAPALVEAAKTGVGPVRTEALKALRDLAGEGEIPSLVDLIFVVEPSQADEVGKALSSVARRHSVHRECTQTILSKYKAAGNDGQRVALLMTLGGLGDETALPILRKSLQEGSSEVRYAAIKALSVWPSTAVAGDLVKVVESTDNRTHRILALRGYVDLIDSASLSADEKLEHYRRAMQLADQDAEKKKVLSSLGTLDTLGAFQMAAALADDLTRQPYKAVEKAPELHL